MEWYLKNEAKQCLMAPIKVSDWASLLSLDWWRVISIQQLNPMKSNADIVRAACHLIGRSNRSSTSSLLRRSSSDYTRIGERELRVKTSSVREGLPDYREEIKLLIDGVEYLVVALT